MVYRPASPVIGASNVEPNLEEEVQGIAVPARPIIDPALGKIDLDS